MLNQKGNSQAGSLIKAEDKSPTGRIKTMLVADQKISAAEFRNRLGLNSTNITWKSELDKVTFVTRGYGHGVGLCQYGANGMAKEGRRCEEIIEYYYQGVEIREVGN
jgi:stage II sporulation protein D